ncbi:hypothetical protein HAX54_036973 [Datura stramonium]|uniref:Uncharacterized protein n=1 Tax=Datura stramonium TaxID=4076 RepID=A0ABS8VIZ4_DATST|nr:hypothetical protein [Datura stramonium]
MDDVFGLTVPKATRLVAVPTPQGHGVPQPRSPKPTHSAGDEFLTRFARNANLVAMGVAKNLQKVGNRIKEGIDDIFYRRPK